MGRVFLIVLDSFGIGNAPDAENYGDKGANTLKTLSGSPNLCIPNLLKMGLGNIEGVENFGKTPTPTATIARLTEQSMGKDTTTGHWEIAGLQLDLPFPLYPNGFPEEIISEFSKKIGRGVLCNKPYSGTDVILDYGQEHIKTGKLIVYTTADSVFQIAAHQEVVPLNKLYEYCKIAREILVGKHGVGRVIARPFAGNYPNFKRTEGRHDFSLNPPKPTMLNALQNAGYSTISVGKIFDIFAGSGITRHIPSANNFCGIEETIKLTKEEFSGLCFTNLVDFDMLYGHRNDIEGYVKAINYFDGCLPQMLEALKENDILIITADHGCDPGFSGTDHTRECVPLIMYKKGSASQNLGTIKGFNYIAKTITNYFGVKFL